MKGVHFAGSDEDDSLGGDVDSLDDSNDDLDDSNDDQDEAALAAKAAARAAASRKRLLAQAREGVPVTRPAKEPVLVYIGSTCNDSVQDFKD